MKKNAEHGSPVPGTHGYSLKRPSLRNSPSGSKITYPRISVVARFSTKIGLLDHLGGGNLGDDATLDAVMQNIKSRWPQAEIFGFSMNPSDTESRHGIRSYPIRVET